MTQHPDNVKPSATESQEDFRRKIDTAMLEDKNNDGYFKRACANALREQIRRQELTD